MCWTFEMAIGAISDQTLRGFLQRLRGRFGIAERCLELTIRKFKVSLSTKDFKVTPEFPKGRLFEIDCEEQWQTALKYLVNRERELIGTCCALTYSYLLKVRQSSKELKSIICFIYLLILVDGYRKLNWDCFLYNWLLTFTPRRCCHLYSHDLQVSIMSPNYTRTEQMYYFVPRPILESFHFKKTLSIFPRGVLFYLKKETGSYGDANCFLVLRIFRTNKHTNTAAYYIHSS